MWRRMRTQQMSRAASAPWCGSALMGPDSLCPLTSYALRPKARFSHCRLAGKAHHRRCLRRPKRARSSIRRSWSAPQLPRHWIRLCMTSVVSKVSLMRRRSAQCLRAAYSVRALSWYFIWYFADLCRSPPQRAAVPQICLHMQRDLTASNPRMRGSIQRCPLTATNSMNRVPQQTLKLRGHDRVEH